MSCKIRSRMQCKLLCTGWVGSWVKKLLSALKQGHCANETMPLQLPEPAERVTFMLVRRSGGSWAGGDEGQRNTSTEDEECGSVALRDKDEKGEGAGKEGRGVRGATYS